MTCTTYKKLLPKRSGCDADASAFYSGCNDNVSKKIKKKTIILMNLLIKAMTLSSTNVLWVYNE